MRTAQCSSQSANIATDFQIYELENDPTYFSEVLRRYQSTVESLLSHLTSENLEAIDQEDLNYFIKTYGDSSYVCRYRQCPRASNGFHSQKHREAHEVLHFKRFKCADTSCEFYAVGFATKNALKTHDQRYHTKQKDKDVPKFPQKASKTLPETRHEDSANRSLLPPTSAAGQGSPTQYAPLRSNEIAELPLKFLGFHLRQYYSELVQNCWDVIEKPNEPRDEIPYFDPSTAQQQLYDLSSKLKSELLAYKIRLIEDVGNNLSKVTLADLPADLKEETDTWHAVFNPRIPRILDINYSATLQCAECQYIIVFSQDGKLIATVGERARVFDVLTGTQVCSFQVAEAMNCDFLLCCFNPGGSHLAISDENGDIGLWKLSSHRLERALSNTDNGIDQLYWSKNGNIIFSEGNTIRVWDPDNTGEARCMFSAEVRISHFSFASDGEHLAAASGHSVYVWQFKDGLKTEYNGHYGMVISVAFSPDGKRIISGSQDCTIKIWAIDGTQKSSCLATLKVHGNLISDYQFTRDDLWILSTSQDEKVHFSNTTSGELQASLLHERFGITHRWPIHSF